MSSRAVLAASVALFVFAVGAESASAIGWLPAVPASADSTCALLKQSTTVASTHDGTTIAAWEQRADCLTGPTRVMVAVRPPGAAFGAPQLLSDPTFEATAPKLASDAAGNVIAVWVENGSVRYSRRPVGGGFSAAATIAGAGPGAGAPEAALGVDTAVVAWTRAGNAEVAVKPAGSDTFGAPQTFLTPVQNAADVDVAVDEAGAAMLTWQTIGPVVDTLHAAASAPGGVFSELAPVFATTANVDAIRAPQVEIDAAGRATLVWTYFDSASSTDKVQTAERAPTGDFGAADTISNASVDSAPLGSLDLAIDAQGNAIAVWWAGTMQAAYKRAGGSFGPVIQNISAPNFVITTPQVAFDPSGRAVAVWLSPAGAIFGVQGAVLAKGATSFGPVAVHAQPSAGGDVLDGPTPIALDDQGNAVSVWRHALDTSPAPAIQPGFFRIESAALDTVAPALTVSIPSSGIQDVPVTVLAAAADRLSTPAITWSFGDGASATGARASHAFARGGTFTVTATATDGGANTTSVSGAITIPPIPATGPDPRLTINDLQVSPAAFRAATKGPSVKSGSLKPWTRVTYSLNVPAKVRFSFERPRAGRRAGSRCAKPAPSNRRGRACTRYVAVKGGFSRTRPRGADRFTFTGRLLGRRLAAGGYRLVAKASANGRSGAAARRTFRIVPRTGATGRRQP
jgi:PKD domain